MKNILNYFLFDEDWFNDFSLKPLHFDKDPKINIKETDEAYDIEIVNPGFSKNETNIKVEDGVLYVSMTSESKSGEEDGKYHCKQWEKSSYQESWNLPENVIEDQIYAKNVDGVLKITLPKKKEESKKIKSRTIDID